MTFVQAIIIALVEGITEFLPISSTGHMILVGKVLGINQSEFVKSFEIYIQLGAIAAITLMYSRSIIKNIQIWKPLTIAFLPTALVGVIFYQLIKVYLLGNAYVTVISLFVGGILLLIFDRIHTPRTEGPEPHAMKTKQALIIGIAQSLSVIPGVSRSAATIIGGQVAGLTRVAAVDFSFLLAIPTMIAATTYDLVKSRYSFTGEELIILGVGTLVAFVSAWITVSLFRTYVRKYSFVHFGMYRIVLAVLYWGIILA